MRRRRIRADVPASWSARSIQGPRPSVCSRNIRMVALPPPIVRFPLAAKTAVTSRSRRGAVAFAHDERRERREEHDTSTEQASAAAALAALVVALRVVAASLGCASPAPVARAASAPSRAAASPARRRELAALVGPPFAGTVSMLSPYGAIRSRKRRTCVSTVRVVPSSLIPHTDSRSSARERTTPGWCMKTEAA